MIDVHAEEVATAEALVVVNSKIARGDTEVRGPFECQIGALNADRSRG